MNIDALQTISTSFYIAAIVFFIVAVLLFILFKIPKVFGDISGLTARKSINEARRRNEISGDKAYKSSPENLRRGKITEKITSDKTAQNVESIAMPTSKISTGSLSTSMETTVLETSAGETTVLETSAGETTVLETSAGETTVLETSAGETTVLSEEVEFNEFTVEFELGFTGSDEVIE